MFGLILFSYLSLTLSAISAPLDFIKGMSLYSSGKQEEAYPILEKVYEESESSPDKKLGAAIILAYAPNSLLKNHKRHIYAEFYYKEHSKRKIKVQPKTLTTLVRIAADGYFDEQRFDIAVPYYELLSKDKEIRNKTYGIYRLGWVELNQQQPTLALLRWSKFLKQDGKLLKESDPDLFRSIVKDAGRAWSEGIEYQTENTNVSEKIAAVSFFKSCPQDLAEGIVQGLKRLSKIEMIVTFREELKQTPFVNAVLSQMLNKGVVFNTFPCEITQWIDSKKKIAQLDPTQTKSTLMHLNQCAEKVVEKQQCSSVDGVAVRKVFDLFPLKGQELTSRVSLSISCKQWESGCRDLIDLTIQQAQTLSKRLDSASMQSVFEVCAQSMEKPPSSKQLREDYKRLIDIYVEKNLLTEKEEDPINELTKDLIQDQTIKQDLFERITGTPTEIDQLIQSWKLGQPIPTSISKKAELYSKFIFPKMLAEILTEEECLKEGIPLLILYGKKPLSATWLRILEIQFRHKMEQKDFKTAESLLNQYLELNENVAKEDQLSGLWEYFWLGLDEKAQLEQTENILKWISFLPLSKLKIDRIIRTFAIALQYGQIEPIWKNWSPYSQVKTNKPEFIDALYQMTLQQLTENKISESLVSKTEDGKILVRIFKNDPTLTPKEVKKVLKNGTPLMADLSVLEQLQDTSKKLEKRGKLRLNAYFLDELTRKMKLFQKEESLLTSTQWATESAKQKANDIFEADGKKLQTELEKIQKTVSKQPDLAELTQQLGQIIEQIGGQINQVIHPTTSEGGETAQPPQEAEAPATVEKSEKGK